MQDLFEHHGAQKWIQVYLCFLMICLMSREDIS